MFLQQKLGGVWSLHRVSPLFNKPIFVSVVLFTSGTPQLHGLPNRGSHPGSPGSSSWSTALVLPLQAEHRVEVRGFGAGSDGELGLAGSAGEGGSVRTEGPAQHGRGQPQQDRGGEDSEPDPEWRWAGSEPNFCSNRLEMLTASWTATGWHEQAN